VSSRDRGDRDSAFCQVDRVGETAIEPKTAEAVCKGAPARNRAWNRDGARASLLYRSRGVGAARGGSGGVEAVQSLTIPDDRERVAADSRGHWLGNAQDGRSGQGSVRRAAALLEGA
jgi:hypothetical protein